MANEESGLAAVSHPLDLVLFGDKSVHESSLSTDSDISVDHKNPPNPTDYVDAAAADSPASSVDLPAYVKPTVADIPAGSVDPAANVRPTAIHKIKQNSLKSIVYDTDYSFLALSRKL